MAFKCRVSNRTVKAHGLLERWLHTRDPKVRRQYHRKRRHLSRRERKGIEVLISQNVIAQIINEEKMQQANPPLPF